MPDFILLLTLQQHEQFLCYSDTLNKNYLLHSHTSLGSPFTTKGCRDENNDWFPWPAMQKQTTTKEQ